MSTLTVPHAAFCIDSPVLSVTPLGNGHINSTYLLETQSGERYTLQKINRKVFTQPDQVMANIEKVTAHIRKKDPDPRAALTVIPANNGRLLYEDEAGECWRTYRFIPDSLCLDSAASPEDFYQSGVGFGSFQRALADFPADTLYETIPRFHDTENRFRQMREAIERDKAGRAKSVQKEIEFFLAREKDARILTALTKEGVLPLRVTHNDTKLNNVLLDAKTRKALCVIDLDTVMPGLSVHDFGDSIRFGASTAAEDEPDLSKVHLDMDLFTAYTKGFLSACGQDLTRAEVDKMVQGARMMTMECGVRFLADHLNGDVYYRIARPGHNLDRARTQMRLIEEMEARFDECNAIVHAVAGR